MTRYITLREFDAGTRFEVAPAPPVPFRATGETEFDRLKGRLLREALEERPEPRFNALLRRAANEAESLVWLTPFPLFFFPGLFAEKVEAAVRHDARQNEIRLASPRYLEAAA